MGIKVISIDTDHIGQPRNDGTRGSGLYRVPVKLSARPSSLWAQLLPQVWDNPSQWTSMHRPGIARVEGDCIVLDGTTVEEVRDVHVQTLKIVVDEVNRKVEEAERGQEAKRRKEETDRQKHEQHVRDIASKIRFDDK